MKIKVLSEIKIITKNSDTKYVKIKKIIHKN